MISEGRCRCALRFSRRRSAAGPQRAAGRGPWGTWKAGASRVLGAGHAAPPAAVPVASPCNGHEMLLHAVGSAQGVTHTLTPAPVLCVPGHLQSIWHPVVALASHGGGGAPERRAAGERPRTRGPAEQLRGRRQALGAPLPGQVPRGGFPAQRPCPPCTRAGGSPGCPCQPPAALRGKETLAPPRAALTRTRRARVSSSSSSSEALVRGRAPACLGVPSAPGGCLPALGLPQPSVPRRGSPGGDSRGLNSGSLVLRFKSQAGVFSPPPQPERPQGEFKAQPPRNAGASARGRRGTGFLRGPP